MTTPRFHLTTPARASVVLTLQHSSKHARNSYYVPGLDLNMLSPIHPIKAINTIICISKRQGNLLRLSDVRRNPASTEQALYLQASWGVCSASSFKTPKALTSDTQQLMIINVSSILCQHAKNFGKTGLHFATTGALDPGIPSHLWRPGLPEHGLLSSTAAGVKKATDSPRSPPNPQYVQVTPGLQNSQPYNP